MVLAQPELTKGAVLQHGAIQPPLDSARRPSGELAGEGCPLTDKYIGGLKPINNKDLLHCRVKHTFAQTQDLDFYQYQTVVEKMQVWQKILNNVTTQ